MKNVFDTADILLPRNVDMTAFSVVACDQYTSEPEYFERIKKCIGEKPSTLKMVFPEAYLKTADFNLTIKSINQTMQEYLNQGLFDEHKNCFFYVRRSMNNGKVRKGLIGKIDLEEYDFSKASTSKVRATEGTVLERIPPRVKIREDAPLELPHIMLLLDDSKKEIIEPLSKKLSQMERVYDFEMMESSGHLTGYKLDNDLTEDLLKKLDALNDAALFRDKYNVTANDVLSYAVGDGNHSLATARQCYLNLKAEIGEEQAKLMPARYALCELVNLHDTSLEFEAIHRIVFGVSPDKLLTELGNKFAISTTPSENSQKLVYVVKTEQKIIYINNPCHTLAVGSLQMFLDEYIKANGGEVDYIHGEDVVISLSKEENSIGFLLEAMDKNDLFKTVILDGALPRKTFSMGEACDKRFYLEGRKIK